MQLCLVSKLIYSTAVLVQLMKTADQSIVRTFCGPRVSWGAQWWVRNPTRYYFGRANL